MIWFWSSNTSTTGRTEQNGTGICPQAFSYIGHDCDSAETFENVEPDPDIFDSLRHGSTVMDQQLLGVQSQLEDVVQEGEQRGQRKRCDEDGDEAVLDH